MHVVDRIYEQWDEVVDKYSHSAQYRKFFYGTTAKRDKNEGLEQSDAARSKALYKASKLPSNLRKAQAISSSSLERLAASRKLIRCGPSNSNSAAINVR